MFTDSFTLSRNSWHARLMKYMWGLNYYDFSHICPYFWMSILNVVLSVCGWLPLLFIFKTVIPFIWVDVIYPFFEWMNRGIIWMEDAMNKWAVAQERKWVQDQLGQCYTLEFETKVANKFFELSEYWIEQIKMRTPNIWEIEDLKASSRKENRELAKWLMVFRELKITRPDVFDALTSGYKVHKEVKWNQLHTKRITDEENRKKRAYLDELEKERKEKIEAAKRAAQIARKKRIAAMTRIMRPIGMGVVILIIIGAAVVIIYLLRLLAIGIAQYIGSISRKSWMTAGEYTLWGTGGILVIVGIILLGRMLARRIEEKGYIEINIPIPAFLANYKWKKHIFRPLGRGIAKIAFLISYPFVQLIIGIGLFFKIFFQTIKNNCPAIHWKE